MNNNEQKNLDMLVKLLQARLQSTGKTKEVDTDGNTTYVDTDVYSRGLLESFITLSISEFNQIPIFTHFTLADDKFVETFAEVLVEGATIYALSSQALIERGREFAIVDDGVSYTPPPVAEMLNTQFSILLTHHFEKLKLIKPKINLYKTTDD